MEFSLIFYCIIFVGLFKDSQNLRHNLQQAPVGSKICMKILGCFEITPDFFDLKRRPINLLPQYREVISTKFNLYTKSNPTERYVLDTEKKGNLESSPLDPKYPTKFIIHGYLDNEGFGPWQEILKNKYMMKGRNNVIIVDWSDGNSLPYTQAVANARIVGAEIAYLIKTLQTKKNLKPENCHIIGHSLGSHIAGYAGERTINLGRITGLDPAEPYFQYMPRSVRLDETDAQFVDVIHTDSRSILLFGLGMIQPIGHVDFYPNNGRDQPGCGAERIFHFITDGMAEGIRRFVGCNHQRAVDFFTYSINRNKCLPVGYECDNWNHFLEAKCTDCGTNGRKCAIMGDKAILSKGLNQTNMKLYLKMDQSIPYCLEQYEVIIKLYRHKNSKDAKGTWKIILEGDKNNLEATLTRNQIGLYPGSRYNYLVTSSEELGNLKNVRIKWRDPFTILNPLNWFRKLAINIEYIKVIPLNNIDASTKTAKTGNFCPKNPEKSIYSDKDTVLDWQERC